MKSANCSDLIKLSIPAIRYALAHELAVKYGMEQSRIAVSLGITQAAVNKYLSGKCSVKISKLGKAVLSKGILSSEIMGAAVSSNTEKLNGLMDRIASGEGMVDLARRVLGMSVSVPAVQHKTW